MIATCTNCQARYQLEDAKVPKRIIKVRCPACSGVFSLNGAEAANVPEPEIMVPAFEEPKLADTPAGSGLTGEHNLSGPGPLDQPEIASDESPVTPLEESTVEASDGPAVSPVAEPTTVSGGNQQTASASAAASIAVLDEPAPAIGKGRRRRCKEEMLARALVSDILVYNRETRDAGIADGNLLESLGGEIKKSWELYKEKVTPEVANSTTYFREALNEILADGDQVF